MLATWYIKFDLLTFNCWTLLHSWLLAKYNHLTLNKYLSSIRIDLDHLIYKIDLVTDQWYSINGSHFEFFTLIQCNINCRSQRPLVVGSHQVGLPPSYFFLTKELTIWSTLLILILWLVNLNHLSWSSSTIRSIRSHFLLRPTLSLFWHKIMLKPFRTPSKRKIYSTS